MLARSLVRSRLTLTWLVLSVACGGPAMRVPAAALQSPPWALHGYSEGREREFTLGGARVHDVQRSRPPAALARRVIAPTTSTEGHYAFTVEADGVPWQGACDERMDPKPSIVGFGSRALQLSCVCAVNAREPAAPHASFSILNGRGSLQLSDGSRFELSPVRETADGKPDKHVLGYALSGPRGGGALERTGSGRAFAPAGLDARASSELRCLYAALLLYRS
jgi:hypothetical protein